MHAHNVGAIYGNVGTTEFRFAVSDPTLKRLDYVKVLHETEGTCLAQVTEITRESSLTFEAATGHDAPGDQAPTDRLAAHAKVIGYRDARGLLQSPRTPLRAGEPIYRADEDLIARVFGLKDKTGAFLGFIKGHELPTYLDINTLVQKHVSVLAKTGSGKSYAVGVLMEELIKRGVPVVIIDPHGEHSSLAHANTSRQDAPLMRRFGVTPRGYAEHIIEYTPDPKTNKEAVPLRLDSMNLSAIEIAGFLGGKLTSTQMGILHAAVRDLQDEENDYSLMDVLDRVKAVNTNAKWNLVTSLEFLMGLDLFSDAGTPTESLVKRDKVSILNLKGVAPEIQEVVMSTLSKKLFDARKAGKVPPFMLVVEEAHNFCPERGMNPTQSGEILRTLASEGRKFGMGLLVVSQRPAKVDKNVLSQCATQIILKITNPHDLKAIGSSVEGMTADTEDEIQRVPVGVAIVSHPRFAMPIMVEVRPRETSHGGESVDIIRSVDASPTFLESRRNVLHELSEPAEAADDAEDGEPVEEPPAARPATRPAPAARARPPPVEEDAPDLPDPEEEERDRLLNEIARAIGDEADVRLVKAAPATRGGGATAKAKPNPKAKEAPPAPAPARPGPRLAPSFLDEARAAHRLVSEMNLGKLGADELKRVDRDLTDVLARLSTLPPAAAQEAAPVASALGRYQAHVHDQLDELARRENSTLRRLWKRVRSKPGEESGGP